MTEEHYIIVRARGHVSGAGRIRDAIHQRAEMLLPTGTVADVLIRGDRPLTYHGNYNPREEVKRVFDLAWPRTEQI